jgi:hypothetical protein
LSGKIKIDGGNLVFEIHGMDSFLALKRSVTVPLTHVTSVSTDKASWDTLKQIRVVGSGLSGVVKDGTFLAPDGTVSFFEMHDPDKCITVNLKDDHYKKIVFQVDDKDAAAAMIYDALKGLPT